ncbi:hypothetical protein GCM10023238_14420 [Streptomyces heliomycini]
MDTERVGRTIAEVTTLLARRERFFLEHGIDSMATYRKRRAAGEFPDEPHGDVFLAIDGWATVRQTSTGTSPRSTRWPPAAQLRRPPDRHHRPRGGAVVLVRDQTGTRWSCGWVIRWIPRSTPGRRRRSRAARGGG